MNVERVIFQSSAWVPNNQNLPVLIYQAALQELDWQDFETAFAANGWTGLWRDGVFDFQHYHSGAHEVLGVASGSAKLLIGGPDGCTFHVVQGDCLILPAGDRSSEFGSITRLPGRRGLSERPVRGCSNGRSYEGNAGDNFIATNSGY